MSDNHLDITIMAKGSKKEITVTYWHYNRDKENPKMTSSTTYRWSTSCPEILDIQ